MTAATLSAVQIRRFEEDGYLILEDQLDPEFVGRVLRIARRDPQLSADAKGNQNYEGEGLDTRLAYRPALGDDAYSALARSRRIVGPLEQLWGDRVRYYYGGAGISPGLRLPLPAVPLPRLRQRHGRPRSGHPRQRLPEGGARLQPPVRAHEGALNHP